MTPKRSRKPERLSILLLCDNHPGQANTVLDHEGSLTAYSRHKVRVFNPCGMERSKYLDLNEFDVVVVHYSLFIVSDYHLAPDFREKLRKFPGLKIQFIQDEYRLVDQMAEMMRYLGIRLVFTLVPPSEIPKVYNESRLPGVVTFNTLAGYVPQRLAELKAPALAERPIDVGYRGRPSAYWLGRHAQEKVWIGAGFLARAEKYGLQCDIKWGEADRIYGQRWNRFLSNCKAVLGTESGASIADFDGSIELRARSFLLQHPAADFEEVHRKILHPYEGNVRYYMISPRIFEAAVLRTALILFPGEYSGVVRPWVHYIPLAKDFSNMDEVVKNLRDLAFLRSLTETAYADLVASGRFSQRSFAKEFDEIVSQYGEHAASWWKISYHLSRLEKPSADAAAVVSAALRVAQKRAQRVLWIPLDVFKGVLTLFLLLRIGAGRAVLFGYVKRPGFRRAVHVGQLLRDLMKLAVLGQCLSGKMKGPKAFALSVSFIRSSDALVFESHGAQQSGVGQPEQTGGSASPQLFWGEVHRALREGRLKTIVWDHSAFEGRTRYVLADTIGVPVCVADNNVHSFDEMVTLSRQAPAEASAVLSSILGCDNVHEDLGASRSHYTFRGFSAKGGLVGGVHKQSLK